MISNLLAVFPGRFQPFHRGHLNAVLHALKEYEHLLIVLGSSDKARTPKNPWTPGERMLFIMNTLQQHHVDLSRVHFVQIPDTFDEDEWYSLIESHTLSLLASLPDRIDNMIRVAVVARYRDEDSYWIKDLVKGLSAALPNNVVQLIPEDTAISATSIRTALFRGTPLPDGYLGHPTADISLVIRQYHHEQAYQQSKWAKKLPLETADIAVFVGADLASSHLLCIHRSYSDLYAPGQKALPGGFVEAGESPAVAAVRELKEETGLCLSEYPHKILTEGDGIQILGETRGLLRVTNLTVVHLEVDAKTIQDDVFASFFNRNPEEVLSREFVALSRLRQGNWIDDHWALIKTAVRVYKDHHQSTKRVSKK